eukprot:TRINITY_DN53088_c0_g1_i1.p1 TRINITY_DN53088_c0_g1~~TRINITY_DN53088_c0_g1_i1.p1  ORF type:complete len:118 (+),score=37.19 TRINITY_DN53088_c0_g1_i1:61-414(+)
MIRGQQRTTLSSSSAASDVYKRQTEEGGAAAEHVADASTNQGSQDPVVEALAAVLEAQKALAKVEAEEPWVIPTGVYGGCMMVLMAPVSYTHLRAHETPEHLVCRLLLEKKKTRKYI